MTDPLLRRLERNAVAACLGMAAIGGLWGGWPALAGVLGGGLLAAVSYASIASGVTALTGAIERASAPRAAAQEAPAGAAADAPDGGDGMPAEGAAPRRRTRAPGGKTLAKVVFRYALLILLAYVMIARLRLHPVGVLAGMSSVVAAVALEAGRILVKKP